MANGQQVLSKQRIKPKGKMTRFAAAVSSALACAEALQRCSFSTLLASAFSPSFRPQHAFHYTQLHAKADDDRTSEAIKSSTATGVGKILGRADQAQQQRYVPPLESESHHEDIATLPPPGLPLHLHNLSINDEPLFTTREVSPLQSDDDSSSSDSTSKPTLQPYSIERVSQTPPVYLLRNFLSPDETLTIAQCAHYCGEMDQAETYADNGMEARPNSTVTFLSHDVQDNPTPSAKVVDALADEVGEWFLDAKGKDCWAEPMQVVRYTEGGKFVLHHDSCDRVVTALYFLNGVGGTWFPLAEFGDDANENFPKSREEAVEASRGLLPGKDGLLVAGAESGYDMDIREKKARDWKREEQTVGGDNNGRTVHIQAGDAIAFYNLRWLDEEEIREIGEEIEQKKSSGYIAVPDWRSFHSGLPVEKDREQEKWIANHWLHVE